MSTPRTSAADDRMPRSSENPPKTLAGYVAFVTGGSSGIGRATTWALRRAGAHVASLDLSAIQDDAEILRIQGDVTSDDDVRAAIEATVAEYGRLDVLVNDAGVGTVGTIEDTTDQDWLRVFDVNVVGMARVTRAALPYLRRAPAASITNVSSVAATVGLPKRACYSASKGAVISLTLATAADLVPEGIRVNCVCPGTVDTPWVAGLLEAASDPVSERTALEARQPMGRLGSAAEIADAIVFLASPQAGFITGTALQIDGGLNGIRLS